MRELGEMGTEESEPPRLGFRRDDDLKSIGGVLDDGLEFRADGPDAGAGERPSLRGAATGALIVDGFEEKQPMLAAI